MKNGMKLGWVLLIIGLAFSMWLNLSSQQSVKPEKKIVKKEVKEEISAPQMVAIERSDGTMETVELEAYVRGVVSCEMPARFHMEALKAQSVAARTFVLKRNLMVDDTTSSQVYKSDDELKVLWGDDYTTRMKRIEEAVTATAGEVLTYDGAYITAAFFSSCGNKTNSSGDYWDSQAAYLTSVDSPWDAQVNDQLTQTQAFSTSEVGQKLGFQNPIQSITGLENFETGYVKSLEIDQIRFTGRELREKLGLRSNQFKVSLNQDQVVFEVSGYGHGIGMSQYGAYGMAEAGKDYKAILAHYYTGTTLEKR